MQQLKLRLRNLLPPAALRTAHTLLRIYWRMFSPKTTGVKIAILNGNNKLLLVRHAYGSNNWNLPGGGFQPGRETPVEAARREAREELSLELRELQELFRYESRAEYKRDIVILVEAFCDSDGPGGSAEIREAQFFDFGALPQSMSKAVREYVSWRRIGDLS